jgi:hypothetical protein
MKRAFLLLFLTSCGGLAFSPLVEPDDAGDAGDVQQLGDAGSEVAGDDAAADSDSAVLPGDAAADAGPDASGVVLCCAWVDDGGAHVLSCNSGAWGCYVDGSAVAFSCSNTSDPCAIGDRCVVNNTFQYGEVHVCP